MVEPVIPLSLQSWNDRQSSQIAPLIATLGTSFSNLLTADTALPYSQTNVFLRAAGLPDAMLQSFPVETWKQMLRDHGLLFEGTLSQPGTGGGHVRFLYVVGGSGGASTTTMMVIDPAGGRKY